MIAKFLYNKVYQTKDKNAHEDPTCHACYEIVHAP